jgi:S1-C subfamily serine protease
MSNAVAWLNSQVLPEVLQRNNARHHRAAPPPPRLDVSALESSLWILECEQSTRQGTAFALEGVGLVTCEHVLGPETHAFQKASPNDKRRITVLAKNAAIDLATISIDTALPIRLPRGSADSLKIGDPITVCGFPNYRIGDTGTTVPGSVVGFRPISGIRRILTNAPIVGGASGAPVLDSDGKVIGIAATGADRMEAAPETEHHSIIPVDALQFLPAST